MAGGGNVQGDEDDKENEQKNDFESSRRTRHGVRFRSVRNKLVPIDLRDYADY